MIPRTPTTRKHLIAVIILLTGATIAAGATTADTIFTVTATTGAQGSLVSKDSLLPAIRPALPDTTAPLPASSSATTVDTATPPDSTTAEPASVQDATIPADTLLTYKKNVNTKNTDTISIVVEGIVVVRETGEAPSPDDSVRVTVDTIRCPVSPTGEFSRIIEPRRFYIVHIESRNFAPVSQTVTFTPDKTNYFVTIMLDKRQPAQSDHDTLPPADTAEAQWTISGTIIDSRFEIAIESDSAILLFDGDSTPVSENGNFTVTTLISGLHTFFVSIPGYQQVTETVTLDTTEKQLFITIPTTITGRTITRREITVSAKSLPVHRSASVARIDISRKELERATATMNDPVRLLQTLPGVTAESDVAARPVVRGGDVLESRVFLDGVTLIQPYHFGGVRSTFNQMGLKGLTLYKSGFPAEFHNAQSAIIDASSRLPSDEKTSFEVDVNYLQYCTYLGIPLFKGKAGISVASQGSYYDAVSKLMYRVIGASTGNKTTSDIGKLINIPDYRDYSAGFSLTPSPSLKIFVNEMFNTDRTRFCQGDSMVEVTYHYNREESTLLGTLPETTVTRQQYATWSVPDEGLLPGRHHDGTPVIGKPYYVIDTLMNYASRYNILYGTAQYSASPENLFNLTLAWQKRWWDLDFPTIGEVVGQTVYDVDINQYNGNFGWVYSGIASHTVKSGFQFDYTKVRYNVDIVRFLHEMIVTGSTNLTDFWGPVNGDTALTLGGNNHNEWMLYSLMNRMYVRYAGDRNYYNAGGYLHDSWDITPRLHGDFGTRIEYCSTNLIATISPRISLRYNLFPDHELIGSIGHYTQDNYDISAIALSKDLKPEKVWHAGFGLESKLITWLTQKIDIYGKYYYDLLSEVLTPMERSFNPFEPGSPEFSDDVEPSTPSTQPDLLDYRMFRSSYVNDGRGYAFGAEYMLRFDPFDFWHGWISASWGRSMRQRREGWRWHPFPIDRPLLLSLHNYYRLPKNYEIGLKYRYMSGLPYTSTTLMDNGLSFSDSITIGAFNDRRYAAYQRFDIRFSKGFSVKDAKGHFYVEIWNSTNAPNLFQLDSKNKRMITYTSNLPTTILYVGIDCTY